MITRSIAIEKTLIPYKEKCKKFLIFRLCKLPPEIQDTFLEFTFPKI